MDLESSYLQSNGEGDGPARRPTSLKGGLPPGVDDISRTAKPIETRLVPPKKSLMCTDAGVRGLPIRGPCAAITSKVWLPKSLKVMTVNCRSLRSKKKQDELLKLVRKHTPDIICGTESHLDQHVQYTSAEVFPSSYDIYRKDRSLGGGGVFLCIQRGLLSSHLQDLENASESVWAKINTYGRKPLYICSFYRPPNNAQWPIDELAASLSEVDQANPPNILLCGDFNMPSINWENLTIRPKPQYGANVNKALLHLSEEHQLRQTNQRPTRGRNILDLVFTTSPDLIVSSTETFPGMSDHNIVLTSINTNVRPPRRKPVESKGQHGCCAP